MSKIKRYPALGRAYFITCVTQARIPILIDHIDMFWDSWNAATARVATDLIAWVVLPDHFHVLIDAGENTASRIMQTFKMSFAAKYRKCLGLYSGRTWQNRFWDHIIRDENDLATHCDCIRYNPVKHGYVRSPFAWPHSSIHLFREDGIYGDDWGQAEPEEPECEFGE